MIHVAQGMVLSHLLLRRTHSVHDNVGLGRFVPFLEEIFCSKCILDWPILLKLASSNCSLYAYISDEASGLWKAPVEEPASPALLLSVEASIEANSNRRDSDSSLVDNL